MWIMDSSIAEAVSNVLLSFNNYQVTLSKIYQDTVTFISEELKQKNPSCFALKENQLQDVIDKKFALVIVGQDFKTKLQVSNFKTNSI